MGIFTFNRTSMELKQARRCCSRVRDLTFNRTSMELKRILRAAAELVDAVF